MLCSRAREREREGDCALSLGYFPVFSDARDAPCPYGRADAYFDGAGSNLQEPHHDGSWKRGRTRRLVFALINSPWFLTLFTKLPLDLDYQFHFPCAVFDCISFFSVSQM